MLDDFISFPLLEVAFPKAKLTSDGKWAIMTYRFKETE